MNAHSHKLPLPSRPLLLVAGILLIAACLRAPFTNVPPVLSIIQAVFGLSTVQASILTTLPLLAFAGISPFAAVFAREYGLERSLFGALGLIAVGIGVRSVGQVSCLYLGTAVIGTGIAFGNVLLPSLLKRDFPHHIAAMTGAYALAMAIAAAMASATAVPLAGAFGIGWADALGIVVVLPVAALLVWFSQLRSVIPPARDTPSPIHGGRIWHSSLAWQVTLFMGINSFLYYVLISWLPSMLTSIGYSAAEAGSLHGVMQLASAVPGLMVGPAIRRMRDQRGIAAAMSLVATLGLIGLLVLPGMAIVSAILLGIGLGGCVILSLMFMALRTTGPHQAAALSGMAQSVGYLLAASGPPSIGALHDFSHGWSLPLMACAVLSVVMAALGSLAGRQMQIGG